MGDGPRIAIVGGGLGGTTAALLLQRHGFDCTVYEQSPSYARIGAGINLSPNAARVLRAAGAEPKLMEIGIQPRSKLSRDWDTGVVTYTADTVALAERYQAPFFAFHRGDLLGVLSDRVKPGRIRFGKRLAGLDTRGEGVQLTFADGETALADIVIGADGVNSSVREALLGPEQPDYVGRAAHRAIFPTAALGGLTIADNTKWWSDDSFFLVYFIRETRDEVYVVTGVSRPDWGYDDFGPAPSSTAELRACFAGYHPEVQRIIDGCTEVSLWPMLERAPLPLWSRGPVVMLGDACHPMTPHMGQGACMAMEDAAVLTRCLVEEADAATAFRIYEATRHQRTARVQAESHRNEWMRYVMDHEWLYGYDAMTVPLARPEGAAR